MIDEIAIQQTINRYSEAASRCATDEAADTFMVDGKWEIASIGKVFHGREEIRAAMALFTKTWNYGSQANAPAVITVDGDRATARSVIRDTARVVGSNDIMEVHGCYVDELARTVDGWKFVHRRMERHGRHYYKVSDEPSQ